MAGLPVQVAPAFACCAVLKCCVCSSHCKAQRYHAVPSLPVGRCTRYPCGVVISSHSTCTWHRLISPFSGCSFSGRRAVLCNTGTCTCTEGSNSTVQPTNPTALLSTLSDRYYGNGTTRHGRRGCRRDRQTGGQRLEGCSAWTRRRREVAETLGDKGRYM